MELVHKGTFSIDREQYTLKIANKARVMKSDDGRYSGRTFFWKHFFSVVERS